MRAKSGSGYVIGPREDTICLIGAPAVALAIGLLAALEPLWLLRFLFVISPAHIVLVLYRSHGNAAVFNRFPFRFTVVPLALFAALMASGKVFAFFFYVAFMWDVHHGCMQTFGIGRMYDAKRGNDPHIGRRLDMAMCTLLFLGPLLSGVWFLVYVKQLSTFDFVGAFFFSNTLPAFADTRQGHMRLGIVASALLFCAFYVHQYWRYSRQGYDVSPQKVALFVCTAFVCIWAWGFNPAGMGFFIIKIFHAIQYFSLVWWSERKSLLGRLKLQSHPRGPGILLAAVLVPAMAYGLVWMLLSHDAPHGLSLTYTLLCAYMVIELMHYWWDGFIWSVRKNEVVELVAGTQPA